MIRTLCSPRGAALQSGLLALAVLLGGDGRASADFLFSNLGPGGSFSTNTYDTPMYQDQFAFAFTPASSGQITGIEIAVSQANLNPATGVAYLASDNGGVPGALLMSGPNPESWSFAIPTSPTLLSLDVPNIYPYPQVAAGEQYWLVLSTAPNASGSYLSWANSTNQKGPVAQYVNGSWSTTQNILEGAFAIEGTQSSAVPEPASIGLLGIGLATVWLCRRRAGNRASAK